MTATLDATLDIPTLTTIPPDVAALQQEVRRWCQERVAPAVRALDEADAADFDWDLIQEGHDLGLTRLVVPKQFGGLGYGEFGVAIALEELAAVDAGLALVFGATMLGQAPVLLSGDPRLQARFLPLFSGDEVVLACNAITEDKAGCDLLIPENAEYAVDVMQARREGDHYVLNGDKKFITNGKVAKYGTVFANIEGHEGATDAHLLRRPAGHARASPAARSPTRWATAPASAPSCTSTTSSSRPRTSPAARAAASTSTSSR